MTEAKGCLDTALAILDQTQIRLARAGAAQPQLEALDQAMAEIRSASEHIVRHDCCSEPK